MKLNLTDTRNIATAVIDGSMDCLEGAVRLSNLASCNVPELVGAGDDFWGIACQLVDPTMPLEELEECRRLYRRPIVAKCLNLVAVIDSQDSYLRRIAARASMR